MNEFNLPLISTPAMRNTLLGHECIPQHYALMPFGCKAEMPITPPPPQRNANVLVGMMRRRAKKKASQTTGSEIVHHYPPKIVTRSSSPLKNGKTVLIAYFPWEATKEDITNEFSKVCNVIKVQLVREKQSARPRCFGFVKFSTRQNAERAIEATEQGMIMLNDSRGHVWHLKAEWAKSGDMVDDGEEPRKRSDRRSRRTSRHDGIAGNESTLETVASSNPLYESNQMSVGCVRCSPVPRSEVCVGNGYEIQEFACGRVPNYRHAGQSWCQLENKGPYRCANFCSPYVPVAPLYADADTNTNARMDVDDVNLEFSWCQTLLPCQASFPTVYPDIDRRTKAPEDLYALGESKLRPLPFSSCETSRWINDRSLPWADQCNRNCTDRLKFDESQTRFAGHSWQDLVGGYPTTNFAQPTCGNFGGSYGQLLVPNIQRQCVNHYGAGIAHTGSRNQDDTGSASQPGLGYGLEMVNGCRRFNPQHAQFMDDAAMQGPTMMSSQVPLRSHAVCEHECAQEYGHAQWREFFIHAR